MQIKDSSINQFPELQKTFEKYTNGLSSLSPIGASDFLVQLSEVCRQALENRNVTQQNEILELEKEISRLRGVVSSKNIKIEELNKKYDHNKEQEMISIAAANDHIEQQKAQIIWLEGELTKYKFAEKEFKCPSCLRPWNIIKNKACECGDVLADPAGCDDATMFKNYCKGFENGTKKYLIQRIEYAERIKKYAIDLAGAQALNAEYEKTFSSYKQLKAASDELIKSLRGQLQAAQPITINIDKLCEVKWEQIKKDHVEKVLKAMLDAVNGTQL